MSYPIETVFLREPSAGSSRIIAIFAFRHEAHLVPDLIANITPIVHGYAAWDDRGDHGYHSNEPERRNALNAAAIAMGADWILGIDPDERLEIRAASRIAALTTEAEARVAWTFNLREMVEKDAWRCDGIWGQKAQTRLYPAHAVQRPLDALFHGSWFNAYGEYDVRRCDLNLYHLRHISPDRARTRRDTYAFTDPERRFNVVGYDYLADQRGKRLQQIGHSRRFVPPHADDGQSWGFVREMPELTEDPDRCLWRRIDRALIADGAVAAQIALSDLAKRNPADEDVADLLTIVAQMTERKTSSAEKPKPDLWQRWVDGPSTLREGGLNGKGPLTTIVMTHKAQATTREAVAALRAQSPDLEILVVNSGGGDIKQALGDQLEQVRLIDVTRSHVVGAIRNIGIDASSAPYVSFLAADCIPMPGWVAGRIARHDQGAMSVSSAVLTDRPGTLVGELARSMRHTTRQPECDSDSVAHYGRSYHRRVFSQVGYFAPALQIAEDTEFHLRLDRLEAPVWAPEVAILHRDPASIIGFIRDTYRRAKRDAVSTLNYARLDRHAAGRLRVYRERIADSRDTYSGGWPKRRTLIALQRLFVMLNARAFRRAASWLERAEVQMVSAKMMLALHQSADALIAAQQAAVLDPNNAETHMLIGLAEADGGRCDAAAVAFRRAIDLRPGRGDLACRAFRALAKNNRHDLTGQLVAYVAVLAPLHAEVQSFIAAWFESQGDLDLALDHAQRALLLQASAPAAHETLARIHDARGDHEQAKLRRRSAAELT